MRNLICSNFLLSLSMLVMLPLPALAIPAITCHCFTERAYNPSKPALADPYFLATTQNSFFAVVFNVDKKTIVMKKQQGSASDDLWVAYWVAQKTGLGAETLLQSRQSKETWRAVMAPLAIPPKSLGERFSRELTSGASTARLAQVGVDDLLSRYRLLGDAELAVLRKAGASHQELIIAALLATKTHQPVKQLYFAVKKGEKSWGALLQGAKIDAAAIHPEIATLVKERAR